MTKTDVSYPTKHIEIATCGELYENLRLKKPKVYNKTPKNGIIVDIEYADTQCLNPSDKIVLALHGAPGSHEDFEFLIKHLSKSARVIAPNFPDYSVTIKTKVFRHSAEEKAAFIKDFLKAINVNKIDMLLAHSSAIYPSVLLWRDSDGPQINSFAFFNPGGHRRIKAMKPTWYTEGAVKVYENKFGRTVFKTFGTTFLKITRTATVKADDMHNVILSASTMKYSGFRHLEDSLVKLGESKVPVLFVFSENDRLIEKEIFYEMTKIIGANEENVSLYNEKGTIEKQCTRADNIKVIAFQSGGHYAFLKYTHIISDACDQLLKQSIDYQNCQKHEVTELTLDSD